MIASGTRKNAASQITGGPTRVANTALARAQLSSMAKAGSHGGKHSLPSPLRGGGGDGGINCASTGSASHGLNGRHPVRTPTPDPSPQGGGEMRPTPHAAKI